MSLTPENEFIELNRTFHELSEHAGKSDDVDLSQVFHIKSNLTWNDVLKIPRTVILSEAGSGLVAATTRKVFLVTGFTSSR